MGKVSENGYGFQPGHGKGIFGQPYRADAPMHEARFPAWTESPERRLAVIVTYLERRAHRHQRPMPGTLHERFERASERLAAKHQKDCIENVAIQMASNWKNKKAQEREVLLTCTANWPEKVLAMVDLHWPKDVREVASWDAGQCAFKLGISERSVLVRQLFINLEKIGQELFPDSERKIEDADF